MLRTLCLSIAGGLLGLVLPRPAVAQFEALAAKVPSTANAIALLDAQRIMASPIAQQEGWKERYAQAFASGMVSISPDTRHMVIAAQIDFQTMQPQWEVALAEFSEEHSIAEITRVTQGTPDQFGELPAVLLSDDSYCVQLATNRLGVMGPANRQTVSRWLREVGQRTGPPCRPI
jgi:hypothetical protein